jgi:hypothetical protein
VVPFSVGTCCVVKGRLSLLCWVLKGHSDGGGRNYTAKGM